MFMWLRSHSWCPLRSYRKDALSVPTRVKQIERAIPEQPWYLAPVPAVLVGGVLPFGAVFIELFFIMSSIWEEQTFVALRGWGVLAVTDTDVVLSCCGGHRYYVFGFLMLSLVILLVTCAEISVVMCYFQLCSENHKWWWRAFLTSGSSALYLYLYSALYFYTNVSGAVAARAGVVALTSPWPVQLSVTSFTASLMYFGYMAMVSVAFFLLTGSIGFAGCFFFVRTIYGAIKID